MQILSAIFILFVACWPAAPRVEAQKIVEVANPRERVSPRQSKATYFDLVTKVLPDARVERLKKSENVLITGFNRKVNISATNSVRHENLFGRYGKTTFVGSMTLARLQSMRVQTLNGVRLLLLLSIVPKSGVVQENSFAAGDDARPPETAVLLALFRLAPEIELLDTADVKRDAGDASEVFFSGSFSPVRVAARQDAFFVVNFRREPKRYVTDYAFLTVEENRLKMLSEEAFTEIEANGCENRSKTKSRVVLDGRTNGGYHIVQIRQLLTFDTFASDCSKLITRDLLAVVKELRWNDAEKRYAVKEISNRQTNVFPAKSKRKRLR